MQEFQSADRWTKTSFYFTMSAEDCLERAPTDIPYGIVHVFTGRLV